MPYSRSKVRTAVCFIFLSYFVMFLSEVPKGMYNGKFCVSWFISLNSQEFQCVRACSNDQRTKYLASQDKVLP